MKLKWFFHGMLAIVFGFALFTVIDAPRVSAARVATWDGGGDTDNFNDRLNWDGANGGVLPVNGDSLVFPQPQANTLINVDMNLSVASIDFDCSDTTYYYYLSGTVGNVYTLTVSDSLTYSCNPRAVVGDYIHFTVDEDVDLEGSGIVNETTKAGMGIALLYSDVDTDLNIVGGFSEIRYIRGSTIDHFLGNINIKGGALLEVAYDTLGATRIPVNTGTNVENNATLKLNCRATDYTVPEKITAIGDGKSSSFGAIWFADVNTGTIDDYCTMTLSNFNVIGDTVLFADDYTRVILTNFDSGDYDKLSLMDGSNGRVIIDVPNGNDIIVPIVIASGNSHPLQAETVYDGSIYIINGTRGAITVQSGGTLKGTGTVANVNVNGGTIAPGESPGIINTGNLVYTGGTLEEEIGGTASGEFDQLNVTGTVDLGAGVTNLNITHWNGFAPALNDSFVIINNDSTDAITGTFAGLAEGATTTVDGYTYAISYIGGTDGNDIVLTVTGVPVTPEAPNTGFLATKATPILSALSGLLVVAGLGLIIKRQALKAKINK